MAGFTRRTFVVLGVVLLTLLLAPTVAAVAQEAQYPPSSSVAPASVVKAGGVGDPGDPADPGALAFTGSSDTVPMVWIAAGLVVFGGALVFVARQRHRASNRA
jgi:hypothetical protein